MFNSFLNQNGSTILVCQTSAASTSSPGVFPHHFSFPKVPGAEDMMTIQPQIKLAIGVILANPAPPQRRKHVGKMFTTVGGVKPLHRGYVKGLCRKFWVRGPQGCVPHIFPLKRVVDIYRDHMRCEQHYQENAISKLEAVPTAAFRSCWLLNLPTICL